MKQSAINWPPKAIPLSDLHETWAGHSEKILLFGSGMTLAVALLR